MMKTISAYVNVALSDFDEDLLFHVVELMKDSLREQSIGIIHEDTWEVVKNQRKLYKNIDGAWELLGNEPLDETQSENTDARDILEVMTVGLTAKVEDGI